MSSKLFLLLKMCEIYAKRKYTRKWNYFEKSWYVIHRESVQQHKMNLKLNEDSICCLQIVSLNLMRKRTTWVFAKIKGAKYVMFNKINFSKITFEWLIFKNVDGQSFAVMESHSWVFAGKLTNIFVVNILTPNNSGYRKSYSV